MSFWLGTHSSSCYSSCKPEVREVWLSLHSANGNEHPSCQQYYFLTLQVKCQQHIRTLKNATKPLGLEVTKSSLSSDLSALWIYSSAAIQGQWPWGMPYTTAGTSAHNALVTGHPASERSSLLSPSNSAGWKECQLHYSGSPYSPISWDCYPEKPTAQENSVWPRTSDFKGNHKQSLCSQIKVQVTVIITGRSWRPQISQCLLCLQQPHTYSFQLSIKPFTFPQGTEASVNTDFCKSCFLKYYSSTYNSNGN